MENPSFRAFEWKSGEALFSCWNRDPKTGDATSFLKLHCLVGSQTFDFRANRTYFLYQYRGQSWLRGETPLLKDQYAVCSFKNEWVAGSDDCLLMIIEQQAVEAPFLMGGPIEATGRLKYIDGCTDSLLLAPWKHGQPCLNHLHFPPGIDQTMHTHPSIRVGLVVRGFGECITPWGNIPLVPGQLFVILPEKLTESGKPVLIAGTDGEGHAVGSHCFRTFPIVQGDIECGGSMDVIAFHPNSDFGPTDESHPMVNMTMVDGVSAANIPEIQTK